MQRKIIISSVINQILVAIIEDGLLAELFVERENQQRTVGSIFKGRVENVLPGMSAAFLNIGLERNAFLYVDDIENPDGKPIEKLIRKGQELLVQAVKEPVGTKGARVITQLSIPGRFLVLMPGERNLGVSRQIKDSEERERLRQLVSELRPDGFGLIVRTVAEGCTEAELKQDLKDLRLQWQHLKRKAKKAKTPSLLYRDHDLVHRIIRDVLTDDVTEIVVDNEEIKNQVTEMMTALRLPEPLQVQLYQGHTTLFEYMGLDKELERATKRRVWLDCGGYLVFDATEALMSIDVNTGKFVGKENLETTILETNLQAADAIARQLRLRNIGGIVIIDFIDMESEKHRKKVLQRLEKALASDKIKTHVLGFTQLGLVELSRKKAKKPLASIIESPCPVCGGSGRVLSDETLALHAAQQVYTLAREPEVAEVMIRCHPNVASFLIGNGGANLQALERDCGVHVFVRGEETMDREEIQVQSGPEGSLAAKSVPVKKGMELAVTVERVHSKNSRNGIARVEGFVLDIQNGAALLGESVTVQITSVHKTYAVAEIVARN